VKLFTRASFRVSDNPLFRQYYLQLARNEFSPKKVPLSFMQIKRLLETATLFSLSDHEDHRKLALKISLFCLAQYKQEYDAIPQVAELVLARMGDLPTIKHMVEHEHERDYFSFFKLSDEPTSYVRFPEILLTKASNKVNIGEELSYFTDFQADVFEALVSGNSFAISAPTSAGKSFVLHQYIAHNILTKKSYCAVYVVPTKSLIAEVRDQITKQIRKLGIGPQQAMVFNSADHGKIDQIRNIPGKVIVLTQERLMQLVSNDVDLDIDLLVLDEAQKISDKKRGVIIEDSVKELVERVPALQKVAISPNIADPEKFYTIFGFSESIQSPITTTKTPVGQNIFFVNFSNRKVNVLLRIPELREQTSIDDFVIPRKIRDDARYPRKVWVAEKLLKGKGHTLIYCDTPLECRNVALGISLFNVASESTELHEALEFLKRHVHEQYYLVDYLQHGVGYHYGRMPQFVRLLVKKLFEEKKIDFLGCTSTLLEGVNLPAKNIILYRPKSGLLDPMDKSSILNLAGRAGRLGKDYYGNIYCIDYDTWAKTEDVFDGQPDKVKSAVEKTLTDDLEELFEHLREYKIQGRGKKNIEVVATSLIIKRLRDPHYGFLHQLAKRANISLANQQRIKTHLDEIALRVDEIKDVVLKNRSIDARLQLDLFEALLVEPELELPKDPSAEENSFGMFNNLERIFQLIAFYLYKDTSYSYHYYSFVGSYWISQKSYKMILENKIRYTATKMNVPVTKEFINKMIDDLDDLLETTLKYDYSRGLKCYCDLLSKVLLKRKDARTFCEDLPTFLEAGASDRRIFLLMGAGLSRNAAISIYEEMDSNIVDIQSCVDWLKENHEILRSKLPGPFLDEFENLLGLE
jgi:superfamily II DNA/RNA helicase